MGIARAGKRIVHGNLPLVRSPSGLPTQHIVSTRDGATSLFLGQQWLQPGDRVRCHTHRAEEIITAISGCGEATIGDDMVEFGAGTTLYIPSETVHSFRCTGVDALHVLIVFPMPEFAETTIIEGRAGSDESEGKMTSDG